MDGDFIRRTKYRQRDEPEWIKLGGARIILATAGK
jgi:hypothetical protein